MNNKLILLALTMILISPTSWAWKDVGNGGDLVVCKNTDGSVSREILDYFEANHRYSMTIKNPAGKSAEEKAFNLLARLPLPELVGHANYLIRSFSRELRISKRYSMENLHDEGSVSIPENCDLVQIAHQVGHNPNVVYQISPIWWALITEDQRATLIVHEVLYRLAPVTKREFNSEKVRYVVALLLADRMKHMTRLEVFQHLVVAGLIDDNRF